MAILYQATLTPTKLELLNSWLPSQPWSGDITGPSEIAGYFRFDDPDGEVGIETFVVRLSDGRIVQVPMTYRSAPLDGVGGALIGILEHSVLGHRWAYDGCFDPVYVTALATAILTGGSEAELTVVTDDGLQPRERTTRVTGSGDGTTPITPVTELTATTDGGSTTIHTSDLELTVHRVLDRAPTAGDALTLTGVWPGSDEPVVLASARPH
jgi:Maltokinase N-terminal cap domain